MKLLHEHFSIFSLLQWKKKKRQISILKWDTKNIDLIFLKHRFPKNIGDRVNESFTFYFFFKSKHIWYLIVQSYFDRQRRTEEPVLPPKQNFDVCFASKVELFSTTGNTLRSVTGQWRCDRSGLLMLSHASSLVEHHTYSSSQSIHGKVNPIIRSFLRNRADTHAADAVFKSWESPDNLPSLTVQLPSG